MESIYDKFIRNIPTVYSTVLCAGIMTGSLQKPQPRLIPPSEIYEASKPSLQERIHNIERRMTYESSVR